MANNLRTIYLYIVCLITLSMIIGGIVATVNNLSSYFFPYDYVFFNDNDEYNSEYDSKYDYNLNYDNDSEYERNLIEMQNYKNEKIKNIVVSIAVSVIGAVMYKYHWTIIEKERIK